MQIKLNKSTALNPENYKDFSYFEIDGKDLALVEQHQTNMGLILLNKVACK